MYNTCIFMYHCGQTWKGHDAMNIMTILMNTKRATAMALLAVAVFAVVPIFVAGAADSDYTAATGYVTMKATDANQNSSSFAAAKNASAFSGLRILAEPLSFWHFSTKIFAAAKAPRIRSYSS